ncbi:MAG: hypothetical protein IPI44_09615 [Sulfuritalea sp.]|nr:hypothetical protein [Sulfuritalea sp.]
MKLNFILSGGYVFSQPLPSMGAQAASDTDKAVEDKAPVAGTPVVKKMKPHSHVEVKTGVPQSTRS